MLTTRRHVVPHDGVVIDSPQAISDEPGWERMWVSPATTVLTMVAAAG
jgi:hypothetical protein